MLNGLNVAIPVHGSPNGAVRSFFVILQRHRGAPFDLTDEDKVGPRIVGRAVPFRAPGRARTEIDALVEREGTSAFSTTGHRHAVEQGVRGEIEAIEVSIFRRDRQEPPAAHCLNQDGRVGDIPVVPVLRNKLEMIL